MKPIVKVVVCVNFLVCAIVVAIFGWEISQRNESVREQAKTRHEERSNETPEPGTLALLAAGGAGLLMSKKLRKPRS